MKVHMTPNAIPKRFVLIGAVVLCAALIADAQSIVDQVLIDLGEDTADRLVHPQLPDGNTQITAIGGRPARVNLDDNDDKHFYFAIDNTAAINGSHPQADISFDYYDTGSGQLILQYDSSDPDGLPYPQYKEAGRVDLTDTNQWKTATFSVTDAYFGDRQNADTDFRILKVAGYFYIDTVTVSLYEPPEPPQPYPNDVIGTTHASGKYFFDAGHDYLNEGAIETTRAGMRVIKLWMPAANVGGYYMWNSDWPSSFDSIKAIAAHEYFQEVFRRPFKTYVLTITDSYGFRDGFPDPKPALMEQDFYDLARYLLETYAGTGKVFVLDTWESDWQLRGTTDRDPQYDPDQIAIDGMIRWYNARQAGIERARQDVPPDNVYVYGAAEVNLVEMAMQGRPTVTNDVLPHINMDLVSYSSYDTALDAAHEGEAQGRQNFRNALDYIAAKMPDSSTLDPDGVPFGDKNVFISEYGVPEVEWGSANVELVARVVVEEAYDWGCPWIIYWELYDNECCSGDADPCVTMGGPNPGATPAQEWNDCRGFWLKRVDGTYSPAWTYFTTHVADYLIPPADFDAIIIDPHSVQLTWTEVADEDYFVIERSIDGGAYTLLYTAMADETAYVDETLVAGHFYRYRLRVEKSDRDPTAWFYSQDITPAPGDLNTDGFVDSGDLAQFAPCVTGPGLPYDPQALPAGCTLPPDPDEIIPADIDRDGDVDQSDFAAFQRCHSGSNVTADYRCNQQGTGS